MTEVWEQLVFYLNFDVTQRALIAGVLITLCSSLLGVTLVLKRFSLIGDGLSHVAFGAMSVATAMDLADKSILTLPVTILCAIALLCMGRNRRIKGDAAIAMISVGALSLGYLVLNVFPSSSNVAGDACGTLFGSVAILTLTNEEVIFSAIISVIVVALFILFYNKIFAITFDEDFSKSCGTKVGMMNLIVAVLIATVIVLAMKLVGSLLISALVIFPSISAMRLASSFKKVTVLSCAISVFCTLAGILISILASTPVGSTIVAVDIASFAICFAIGKILGK